MNTNASLLLALPLTMPLTALCHGQGIRLIEDNRQVALAASAPYSGDNLAFWRTYPQNGYDANYNIDAPAAVFGENYFDGLTNTRTEVGVPWPGSAPVTFTVDESATQTSAIEQRPDGSVRVAAWLEAKNATNPWYPTGPCCGGSSSAVLDLTFELEQATTFEITYDIRSGGDESRGAWLSLGEGLAGAREFAALFGAVPFNSWDSITSLKKPNIIALPFTGEGEPNQKDLGNALYESGLIEAGTVRVLAIVDARHDPDDNSAISTAGFELILTPVPQPASAFGVLPLLLITRRRRSVLTPSPSRRRR